jgi:hypothetical protein
MRVQAATFALEVTTFRRRSTMSAFRAEVFKRFRASGRVNAVPTLSAGLLAVSALCLTGCAEGARAGFNGSKLASATPTTNIETVVVTRQPRDKTSEFLSAWRPKN